MYSNFTLLFCIFLQGFTLHFYFAPNDYFSNLILTKEYEMKCEPSEDDPFSFEGPEIFKCKGCTINWKEGKNLTVKTVKKKQKHKSKGNVRTITKQVKNDSFFNFFDPLCDAFFFMSELLYTTCVNYWRIYSCKNKFAYLRNTKIPRRILCHQF